MTRARKPIAEALIAPLPPAKRRKAPADPLERHYTPAADARAILAHVADTPCPVIAGVLRPLRAVLVGRAPPESVLLLEPYAGAGAFMTAARELWHPKLDVDGWDIDPEAPAVLDGRARHVAAACAQVELRELLLRRTRRLGTPPTLQLVIYATNPPWSDVTTRLRDLRNQQRFWAGHGVPSVLCNLQRLTTVEGAARRAQLWQPDPPDLIAALVRRIRWEGPGGALHPQVDKAGTLLAAWGPPGLDAGPQVPFRPPTVFGWIDNGGRTKKRAAD